MEGREVNLAIIIHWASFWAMLIFAVCIVASVGLVACRALGAWWRAR